MKAMILSGIFGIVMNASASAGHDVRNGGSAVVCYAPDGKTIQSVELYDYWEMKRVFGADREVDLGAESLSVEEKIRLFAKKLEFIDPHRSEKFLTVGLSILRQLPEMIRDDLGTTPIADDDARINPEVPCFKELFAVQIREPQAGQTRFMIRRDLYESPSVSNTTRAGIILHEVIYRDAIEAGHLNSRGARRYHYLVSSGFAGGASNVNAYEKSVLKESGLQYKGVWPKYVEGFGRIVHFKEPVPSDRRKGFSGTVLWPTSLQLKNLDLKWKGEAEFMFSPQGYIQEVDLPADAEAWAEVLGQRVRLLPSRERVRSGIRTQLLSAGIDGTNDLGQVLWAKFEGEFLFPHDRYFRSERAVCRESFVLGLDEDWFRGSHYRVTKCSKASSMRFSSEIRRDQSPFLTKEGSAISYFNPRYSGDVLIGYPKSLELAEPTKLWISGTKIRKEFNGKVTFSENGGVIQGEFAEPIEVEILGKKERIKNLWANENGELFHNLNRKYDFPEEKGLPILTELRQFTDEKEGFCALRGLRLVSTWGPEVESHREYVSGQKAFYSFAQRKAVLFTDQYVDRVKAATCYGRVSYVIPD